MNRAIVFGVGAVALLAVGAGGYWRWNSNAEPAVIGGPPTARLISTEQYKHAISYVFGDNVSVPVNFPPVPRTNGLVALGAAQVQVTTSAAELYEQSARAIAAQVTSPENRDFLLGCASARSSEGACAKVVLARYGRLLYRRALTEEELTHVTARATATTKATGDFYQGLASGLTSLLISPEFLFLIERTEPDPDSSTQVRLTPQSIATRLSLLLWDAPPDDELLTAVEEGDLATRSGIQRQADRMLNSPRLEQGVRSFLMDMMLFEKYETLSKDSLIYPAFSEKVVGDSKEETLRTLIDHLVVQKADYRDIFTTRKTFINGDLGTVYRIPVQRPDKWMPYEFPPESGRAGILTQLSFLALYSHPGRSSPTLRGKAMREVFLCQVVPNAPPNVDFSGFEGPTEVATTARERLLSHRKDPACAGCHKITDPIGLALEKFDGAGQFRLNENGAPIDTSGELGEATFEDAVGLGKAFRAEPAAPSCLVNRVVDYSRGYKAAPADSEWISHINKKFADSGYRMPELLRAIAISKAFYAVSPSSPASAKTAAVQ